MKQLAQANVQTDTLIVLQDSAKELKEIFNSPDSNAKWNAVSSEFKPLKLPDNTGGVNAGDQRAISYLIWKFKPVKYWR